jgi:hypothetical protein
LPEIARDLGILDEVIDKAVARCPEIATAMDRLERRPALATR